jgi:hypothetical protein
MNEENLEFDTPLEEDLETIEHLPEGKTIYTAPGDVEIFSLHLKRQRGRFIVQPDFQRHYVWDSIKASRLIESALLNIPLPVIYISHEDDDREYVIDGQQRLTSFFSFIDGSFPDGTTFKLKGLQFFGELNGKKFSELPQATQNKITDFKVRTITFLKGSDQDLKFEVFERLNTGSVSLNDQELRNCIYRGKFNKLLQELSRDEDFTRLLNFREPDKRMRDVELVLRFSAFYHATYLNYKSPMKKFLNLEAERYRQINESDAKDLKTAFKNACGIIRSMFGKQAFKRFYKGDGNNPSGRWEPQKINVSLYDILMDSFAREDKNIIYQNLDAIRESLIDLMTNNQDFIDSIELGTSSEKMIKRRFAIWRKTLEDITGIGNKEPRCFSRELKESLFKANNACKICGQSIIDIDDSAVDHIQQYWCGGKTIPENARLTHRYCNWARPRLER